MKDRLERGGGVRFEYVEVIEPETPDPVAVHLGRTPLIDPVILSSEVSGPELPPPDRSRRA